MERNLRLLCTSANGMKIVFDPINSHTATHFKDAPKLKDLAMELLRSMYIEDELIAKDVDMSRIIGNSDIVEVSYDDEIIFAMRKNREDQGYVPFTKSRASQPTSYVSIYLVRQSEDSYELSSAWFGRFESPMFPQMDNATEESIPYWNSHAFVWGIQEIIPGTERSDCPW